MQNIRLHTFEEYRGFLVEHLQCNYVDVHAIEAIRRLFGGHVPLLQIFCDDTKEYPVSQEFKFEDVQKYLVGLSTGSQEEGRAGFEDFLDEYMCNRDQVAVTVVFIEAFWKQWPPKKPSKEIDRRRSELREDLRKIGVDIQDVGTIAEQLVDNGTLRRIGERYAFNISFPHLVSWRWFNEYKGRV